MNILLLIIGLFVTNTIDTNEIHTNTRNSKKYSTRSMSMKKTDDLYINMCIGKRLSLKINHEVNQVVNTNLNINDIYIHSDKKIITVQAKNKIYNNNKIQIISNRNDYIIYINTVKCGKTNPFSRHFDIKLANN